MRIIRDNANPDSLSMIALLIDWKMTRCNVRDCTQHPTTIIAAYPYESGTVTFALCEHHFQQCNQPEGAEIILDFD